MNYVFYRNILSFEHPLFFFFFEHPLQISEKMLRRTSSVDWIRKCILSLSVSSTSRFFFLHNWPAWYTNEWTDGVITTRKQAHIQEKWTCAGTKANVLFTIISPPNLFIVVNIVGGFKFIIMIWKAIRDIKAVKKTIRSRVTRNVNRSHPWHLSKRVTLLTSLFPGLLTNMS